jgi:hypothetical protein
MGSLGPPASFDVPELHYLLFYWITKIQYVLPIEAILQSCELELQTRLLEGSLEEYCFLGHI